MNQQKPVIFSYLDIHQYLQDFYAYLKASDRGFSYEAWSQRLGFNKDRSFLRLMILGKKKVSTGFIDLFCEKHLSGSAEQEYIRFLMKYSYAKTREEKRAYGDQLIKFIKRESLSGNMENYDDFVSDPLLPRLLTVLGFEDVAMPTKSVLAKILRREEGRIEQALNSLEALGLVCKEPGSKEQHWKALTDQFHVSDDKGNLSLRKFHEKSLYEAIEAFDRPKNQRHYKSMILALSDENLKDFSLALEDFFAEQFTRFNSNSLSGKNVFQINFNYYTVTEGTTSEPVPLS